MILFLTSALAAATAPAPIQFNAGATVFQMPMPQGYCALAGGQIAAGQMLASADSGNVTDTHVVRCDGKATADADYTILKTPVRAVAVTIDRAQIIDIMVKAFDDPQAKVSLTPDAINDKASTGLSNTFGTNVKLTGAIVPLGHDDICFYMGGILEFNAQDTHYTQSVGGCMTSVSGWVITVYRYDRSNTQAGVANLLAEARKVASTIQAVPAK